jgi:hypothetical protein
LAQTKEKTTDQVAAVQAKAVRFLRDVVGDENKADEIEGLTVLEYAERKNFRIVNPASPSTKRKSNSNKRGDRMDDVRTKADLIEENNELSALIGDIWDVVVDLDGSSSKSDLHVGAEDIAEMLNEFDPDSFVIEDDENPSADSEDEAAA